MAGSVNKVILVGNLGRDPEVRSMQDGRSMSGTCRWPRRIRGAIARAASARSAPNGTAS